ncbi:MAG TPA: choice-of-anchor Q domain-containing protein [Rudaea sp.]|jgi:predicted outer membrane repeat protein|nr:choice-of-anchor Q domain-containing protein [Rudaea sp.]
MRHLVARKFAAVLSCLALFSSTASAVCFVNLSAGGVNSGASWSDAYTDLQTALGNAACAEVWVAKGTYRPTAGSSRTVSFSVRPGVALHGGFAGNEVALNGRDLAANASVLSGDIGVAADASDNSYHVVLIDGTTGAGNVGQDTVVDGFTISGGHAADDASNDSGGGLYCNGTFGHTCNPTLSNLVFTANTANYGGAMFANGYSGECNPSLSDVRFVDNSASFDGGAIYSWGGASGVSNMILANAWFENNSAGGYGGAAILDGATGGTNLTSVSDATFVDNHATQNGGAISTWSDPPGNVSPVLTRVTFVTNTAHFGGAIANMAFHGISNVELNDVTLVANSSSSGGAIYSGIERGGTSNSTIRGATFSANAGGLNGGAIYAFVDGSTGSGTAVSGLVLTNATFTNNTAFYGSVVRTAASGTAAATESLNSVTFTGNSTTGSGAAIYNDSSGGAPVNLQLTNAILWGDTSTYPNPEIYQCCGAATATISHSNVMGSHGSGAQWPASLGTDAGGNIDLDPSLGILQYNGGPTVTMMPAITLALNLGTNAGCPATDQRGVSRPQPQASTCDMGAVERQLSEDYIFNTRFDLY